jgi:hypothetical protein
MDNVQDKTANAKEMPKSIFPVVPTTKVLAIGQFTKPPTGTNKGDLSEGSASYASTVSGRQDRPMVDSPDADRPCFPLECDLARRGACPDGKVAVRPSGPYEARVHRAWSLDPTSSTSQRRRADSR